MNNIKKYQTPVSYSRRECLRQLTLGGLGCLAAGAIPFNLEAAVTEEETPCLTIMHTNDVHSRLDPFPMDGGKYQGMGGVVAREKVIRHIRSTTSHALLLDAGDIFQGTPYFNLYKGEPEIRVMSYLGYDAATLGNHDFDNGLDGLVKQLQHARFPIVNCNYEVQGTVLEHQIQPWAIIRKGNLKVGILGVGIALEGLVPADLFGSVRYQDPVQKANETAWILQHRFRCDYIICLSHLGFNYPESNKVSDQVLARESEHINMILGGHTHTFLDTPLKLKNAKNQEVIVNQAGWAGLRLGRIDIYFANKKGYNYISDFTDIQNP